MMMNKHNVLARFHLPIMLLAIMSTGAQAMPLTSNEEEAMVSEITADLAKNVERLFSESAVKPSLDNEEPRGSVKQRQNVSSYFE